MSVCLIVCSCFEGCMNEVAPAYPKSRQMRRGSYSLFSYRCLHVSILFVVSLSYLCLCLCVCVCVCVRLTCLSTLLPNCDLRWTQTVASRSASQRENSFLIRCCDVTSCACWLTGPSRRWRNRLYASCLCSTFSSVHFRFVCLLFVLTFTFAIVPSLASSRLTQSLFVVLAFVNKFFLPLVVFAFLSNYPHTFTRIARRCHSTY